MDDTCNIFAAGLDSVIDRVLVSVKEAVVEAGLDPLPVPDINIPYSLDR